MSTLGKQLHSTTRPKVMHTLEKVRRPGQIGGFAKMEPGFGGLYMRTLQRVAYATQKNCALIFFDLRMAFHGLIREGIYGKEGTDEKDLAHLRYHLEERGLPAGEILGENITGGYLRRINAPEKLTKLLQEYGSNNWSEIHNHTLQTNKGSRPGSPLADCLFHIQMCEISHSIDEVMKRGTSSETICSELGFQNEAIYWADDLCIGVLTHRCEDVDSEILRITTEVQQLFAKRGFEVNFAKNKSEVVVTYKGKEASEFRRKLLTGERTYYEIEDESGQGAQLRVGATYKHLGAMQECGGCIDVELQHRSAQAWDAWRLLRRPVLCSRKLSLKTRLRLTESLIFSKLFHDAGTWPRMTPKQLSKIERTYTFILRGVTNEHFRKDKSRPFKNDDRFFAHYGLPRARIRIAQERLLFAKRLYSNAEELLGELLWAEEKSRSDSWRAALKDDVQWLIETQGTQWGSDLKTIQERWQSQSGWPGFVRRGVRRHILQSAIANKITSSNDPKDAGVIDIVDDTHYCSCGAGFTTAKGLAVHKHKKHGQYTKEYWLQSGTRCEACLKELWTQQRLQMHLKYPRSKNKCNSCWAFLVERQTEIDLSADSKEKTELPLKGLRRREAIQIEGPLPFGASTDHLAWIEGYAQHFEENLLLRTGFILS